MPLFEYVCTECGATFERLIRTTHNQPEIVCPQCKSTETQKLLSGFAVSGGSSASAAASAAACAPGGA
ncbi:MAG: zinc ribbon domain-containing protein [Caldilineaceae bacterium]